MDSSPESERKERRVRLMLKSYYGAANGKKLEADEDPTSVDSMGFDIDQYFPAVLKGQDLAGLQNIMKKFSQERNDLDMAMKSLVAENYAKFLGVSDTMIEINTKMGGIISEMEKLNTQVDAIASDAKQLGSRFARAQEESSRLSEMQDLVFKLQYMSSIPDRLRIAVEMKAYREATKYAQLCHKVLTQYLHIPSFKALHEQCCEYITIASQALKEELLDPKLDEGESADIVEVLLDFGTPPELLRTLYLYGRTAAIEHNWFQEEKSSTIHGDPLASLRECNRTFFTHLLMCSFHFKNMFPPPDAEEELELDLGESKSTLKSSSTSSNSPEALNSSWKLSRRLSGKPLETPTRFKDSAQSAPGRDSPIIVTPSSPLYTSYPYPPPVFPSSSSSSSTLAPPPPSHSPLMSSHSQSSLSSSSHSTSSFRSFEPKKQVETPWPDWNKFVLDHFVKYLNRAKAKIMENDNITEKMITMQALSADIRQVHRQMPELPIQAIDDLVTDVMNDHISKSFASLQENVIENFRQLQTTVAESKSLDDTTSAFQDDLEKNTHYVLSHLQSVMNTLTEMFSSSETHFFKENYQVWLVKVQIKLEQLILTVITVCSEMCDLDTWPKYMKPAFILSIVHLCLFFKKRGLAQIQKTLDNITGGMEKRADEGDSDIMFSTIIAGLKTRCKETAHEVILVYISAHCRMFERMLKKLLETSNWLKLREPREVKLGTALIVDEFFKIFVEVSTLFSILPAPKVKRFTPASSASEIRYSATTSSPTTGTRMTRAPSLPTISSSDEKLSVIKNRHSRTASALPRLGPTTMSNSTGTLPQLSPYSTLPRSSLSNSNSNSNSLSVFSQFSNPNSKSSNSALSNSSTKIALRELFTPVPEEEVAVTFVPDKFKCSATYILFRIVQYIFKSFMERIRTKMMSRGGAQQVDVDTEYMKIAFMKVIPDPRIEGFAKVVRREAATRATDPQPLPHKIIEQLCKEKAQAHHLA